MGRIKKVAADRHTATASPFVIGFVEQAVVTPLYELPTRLDSFPQIWPFPRGDLYHWIPLLDRFDHVLEIFNKEYGLDQGPQQMEICCHLLQRGDAEEGMPYPPATSSENQLQELGFERDGDRQLVESILRFTRVLVEHCGNRSLYASSSRLNDLLNTTSLSLLSLCLRLSLRLAQRYYAARYKNSSPQAQAALLANHYSLNMDRLQKIAEPFPKTLQSSSPHTAAPGKAKEKIGSNSYNPYDLVQIAKGPWGTSFTEAASVNIRYYERGTTTSRPSTSHQQNETVPPTPTPIRQSSMLGPSRDRPAPVERSATTGDLKNGLAKSIEDNEQAQSAPHVFHIDSNRVMNTNCSDLMRHALAQVPDSSAYDVLHRIRIAKAFCSPEDSSQQLLEVRLLAIANLVFALSDSKFQDKIGIADTEQPKQYHLAQQLCDMLQPSSATQKVLSLDAEIAVLLTLEALSKISRKSVEVLDALQIMHNHGILYYELRKVISTLNLEEHRDKHLEQLETEWREATFDLTNALLQTNLQARQGERMIAAGLMAILVEAFSLRTARAERFHEKILQFFDSFIHGISSAFQTLANIKGLDIIADLTCYEVRSALQSSQDGNGLPQQYKSRVVDYDIPFHQQATLRQLFKFMVHMFEHNAGTHDRLLRNLIDTPQVLNALRTVLENAGVFGSNVWSGALNIISCFIHNEPTSFQVVSESGLVQSFLQNIVPWDIGGSAHDDKNLESMPIEIETTDAGSIIWPQVPGILPANDTMCDIPAAFGAICLNEAGMKMFQSSKALYKFMDIFVSEDHVRALEEDGHDISGTIGQAFDELSRHHPQLKDQIIWVVISMVRRVDQVCKFFAQREGVGAKLWERGQSEIGVSGGQQALAGRGSAQTSLIATTISASDLQEGEKDRARGVPFMSACFKFLEGFFQNSSACSSFCERGGAVYLLELATSPSNPHDLFVFPVFSKIAHVVKTMCDSKPHLVLPSLIKRTQFAVEALRPLVHSRDSKGIFHSFTDLETPSNFGLTHGCSGTTLVKALATINILTHLLGRAFSPPSYSSGRNNHTNHLFMILNFTDVYIELADRLGGLHASLLWENLALLKSLPETCLQLTDPKPFVIRRIDASGTVEIPSETKLAQHKTEHDVAKDADQPQSSNSRLEQLVAENIRTVRYLLSQTPVGIESFLHMLGQALTKRNPEGSAKQHANIVARRLAEKLVWEIDFKKFDGMEPTWETKYRCHIIASTARLLVKHASTVESTFPHKEALTLVLNKFYIAGGFDKLNRCLEYFSERVATANSESEAGTDTAAQDGLTAILSFYGQVVRSKCIHDAAQSNFMVVRSVHQADYFAPAQLLVEIRDAVLPAVSKLWNSTVIEGLGEITAKIVIEILKTILRAEGEEHGALLRSQKASRRMDTSVPDFRLRNMQGLASLKSTGVDDDLAREALYRCNNQEVYSREYCTLRRLCVTAPSFPLPDNEPLVAQSGTASDVSGSSRRDVSVDMTDANDPAENGSTSARHDTDASSSQREHDHTTPELGDWRSFGTLHRYELPSITDESRAMLSGDNDTATTSQPNTSNAREQLQPFVVIEDLDEKRAPLREALIDRCLAVLSAQPGVSFELGDLIQAAVAKGDEGIGPRADIGSTLLLSLLSLQGGTGTKEGQLKVTAYSHLVALVLQDQNFFDATLDELKDSFDALVSWIELGPEEKIEDAPWIPTILLIVERALVEDEQPLQCTWDPPPADNPLKPMPAPVMPALIVTDEVRSQLLDALINLLPKVGKNAPLALSILRVLVMLTRNRDLALRLSQKQSIQKLFLMFRQLVGNFNERLRSAFMIILRHMVEDDQILQQVMETEIKSAFESQRSSRAMDATTYARNLSHLVLRDPNMFVDVTQQLVEISRFESPHRGQALALKKDKPQTSTTELNAEGRTTEEKAVDNQKVAEAKPPIVDITDGVISFLLRELSNYRDVPDGSASGTKIPKLGASSEVPVDVEVSDNTKLNGNTATTDGETHEKPAWKPEEHTIYVYRCFLLQCLSELLSSYNRTKVEFVNFSRKPETQPATPSKPRSGTLNYLLNVLMPVGTLEHRDDFDHIKKLNTSYWATSVLVSLCSTTLEKPVPHHTTNTDAESDSPELTFVRRFVLDHALRAFKEAPSLSETLDHRYSRFLVLGELFNRMLTNSKSHRSNSNHQDVLVSHQIGRFMYEKNFVTALTSALAELDLNFPNAKRAVKYMVNPLRLLTDLGVELSQSPDYESNTAGIVEEEDLASVTSISDEDGGRERTPYLYRNSALGMFETRDGDDEDSDSSESDDEDDGEEYDDGYDEEMEYEEGPIPEHGDVVSDEDDDIEDMETGMGEVEGLPGDVGMDIEVVMDDGDASDTDSDLTEDSDDESDDEDDEDDDVFDDQMDEITGDDEGASLADGDEEGDWEEEDGAEYDMGEEPMIGSPHPGPLDTLASVIGGDGPLLDHGGLVRIDMGNGEEDFFEDEMPPEDEDGDEDEEVDYENDVIYEPDYEEDEDDQEMQFEWSAPPPPNMLRTSHHHSRHHIPEMFGLFGNTNFRPFGAPAFRTHRAVSGPRGEDDGTNPLLRREGSPNQGFQDRESAMDNRLTRIRRRPLIPRELQELVQSINHAGNATAINVNIHPQMLSDLAGPIFSVHSNHGDLVEVDSNRLPGEHFGFPRWSGPPGASYHSRGTEESANLEFRLVSTVNRWQEEARLLFPGKQLEQATRVVNSIFRLLIPRAMEAKRLYDEAKAEREAAEAKARAERDKQAEAERLEREAREKKEREEQEAREVEERRVREEATRAASGNVEDASAADDEGDHDMEGVQQAQSADQNTLAAEPEQPAPVIFSIGGSDIDITNLGIDLSYIEALPEELREEVIMTQLAAQRPRQTQPSASEAPSEINREFLDALPPEIQHELLRQEARERRHRAEQEERRRAIAEGTSQPAQPQEMNNADFMAMLEPNLRQSILMDSDENILASLPEDIQAEARDLMGDRRIHIGSRLGQVINSSRLMEGRADRTVPGAARQRRPTMQILDKAGVATLMRLMFVSLHHKAKNNLHSILAAVCKNAQGRAQVISMLLSILQDGTADVHAVERSFTHLSLRARQSSSQKTPQAQKRISGAPALGPGAELSPLNIVQQCLGTLNALSQDNIRVSSFFLSEHETAGVQKVKLSKKLKNRESKAAKYPLNALLALLDRKLITENTGVMETLASLLSRVTHPVHVLLRRRKAAQGSDIPKAEATDDGPAGEQSQHPTTSDVAMTEAATTSIEEQAQVPVDQPANEVSNAKKKHDIAPPDVPEENLRLVVNIISARECPGKTFTDTVDVIRNLSAIPGAKETFGKELVRQAQELGNAVSEELQELAPQIGGGTTTASLQGVALTKFAPTSSRQNKLLRVLLALDYLFDPKRVPQLDEATDQASEPQLKVDILASLYESSTFDSLWNNLSQCLTAIQQKGNMTNVAATLLPAIESLMVVCRNATLAETTVEPSSPTVTTQNGKSSARIEKLFFKFTEEHRKILNELIRNNPKLMNGNLAVMAKNSNVLEFDNKRSYFSRKLHNRGSESRHSHPSLQLNVRRKEVLLDSFKSLYFKTGDEIKYGKLNIRFQGEEGIDAGGVSREWFAAIARRMFDANYALFNPVASDRTTFHPNSSSFVNEEHLLYFKFIGRIMGKALYEGRVLDCHFSRAVYRRLLGKSVSIKDMESLDLDYYKSLVWILENDITDVTFETFSVEKEEFGEKKVIDLIDNGRNIPVTQENKQEYVRLVVEHRLIKSVEEQLEQFLAGFHDIIPKDMIAIFNEQELELLISGLPDIDVDDWKNNTEYHNYQATSPQIQWFWRAVRSFDQEEKAKLLQFITGTSKVPLNGFKELEGMNGFAKFNIHRDYSSKEKLPSSHTCFNQLDLPEYESYEQLRQQLYTAITAGSEYFGFA